jgi:phosphotriesterase-related protein
LLSHDDLQCGIELRCRVFGKILLHETVPPKRNDGEPKVVELISTLLNEGFEKQILLSQDVCHDSQLASYGGNGYTYLQKSFLPRLTAAGVNAATIKTITVENPARLLTLRKPA